MGVLQRASLRHLKHHGYRTALTIVGIAIGIGAIVATTAVSEAVFRAFRHTIEATSGRAQLHVSNGDGGIPESLLERARTLPGVAGAAALVEGFVGLRNPPGQSLAIFGLDLLGDQEREAQMPRSAVHVPDGLMFVSRLDSVALEAAFARKHGLGEGSALEVTTPYGPQTLVVRGTVDAEGPASLFGGAVGLMDLPAAQRLLGKDGRVDRIDVRLVSGIDQTDAAAALTNLVHGQGRVENTATAGARAEDLLLSVHVALSLAGLIAAVVGFFLIFHTVAVSVVQRRTEITLLAALGHSAGTILRWLTVEATILGTVALLLGVCIGGVLARLSMATFGGVASAWLTLPVEQPTLTVTGVALAAVIGLATPIVATLAAAWSFVTRPPAEQLRMAPGVAAPKESALRALGAAAIGLGATAALLMVAPRTLPYGQLLTFIFVVNSCALVSFALLAPIIALGVGHAARAVADRLTALGMALASRSLLRRPAASTAVVAAIVTGVGWTLAFLSLVASLERSWLGWLDEHFQSDLIVSAGTAAVSLLTYPPIDERIAEDLKTVPGVGAVQAIRSVEADYAGRPIVVMALDRVAQALPVVDGAWETERFWDGAGLLVSENLAHKTGLRRGDPIALRTPTGEQRLPALGVFADFQNGGDLGCVALARPLFRDWWRDRLISRIRVWLAPGADLATVRTVIDSRYGDTHGVHALTFAQARTGAADLIRSCFAISNALALIALVISFAGVVNFLLAAIIDRGAELRTLTAVGVAPRQIGAAVVGEGSLIGGVGAAAGILAGIVLSRIIVLHSVPMVNGWRFAWSFPWTPAAVLSVAVVILAAGAGVAPARYAMTRSEGAPKVHE